MSGQGSISHYFPGANTPQGFYSLYDNIAGLSANKIFVIKGGPGVGKSTFMKKLAADLLEQGYDVEFHHCSADNNSIDALYIPAGDIALLDGTAPHVVDPKHPGAVDEIINLGDFWNEAAMRAPANKATILKYTRGCNFRFKRANDCLKAAKAYLEEWQAYFAECLDTGAVARCSEDLIAEILPARLAKAGSARRLFASAITYDGPKVVLSSLMDELSHRYVIQGEPGTGKAAIVGRIADAALARGYSLDIFHCPMYPDRLDHIRIRELGVGVITSAWPHTYEAQEGDTVIDTAAFVDGAKLAGYAADLEAAKEGFFKAIDREMHHLRLAKATHDELEKQYVPHMNFAGIEALRVQTLDRILALIAERQMEAAD
ncbi:MAG: ATPase [Symbiobacteriaceae bacterium]|jgi:hypothetical protein|nr:ATPase [Symbiobacteriaceae bacterium]